MPPFELRIRRNSRTRVQSTPIRASIQVANFVPFSNTCAKSARQTPVVGCQNRYFSNTCAKYGHPGEHPSGEFWSILEHVQNAKVPLVRFGHETSSFIITLHKQNDVFEERIFQRNFCHETPVPKLLYKQNAVVGGQHGYFLETCAKYTRIRRISLTRVHNATVRAPNSS